MAGVIDRVEFGGRVSQADLPRWYRKSDLYVSPSHVDGSSVSLMEALACGLPALVSDIPANKEWVQEDRNGWLFPDGDADALAEKILWIAARPRQHGSDRSPSPPSGRTAGRLEQELPDPIAKL